MATLCVSVVSCRGRPVEDKLALEEASPSLVKADGRDFQAGFHLVAGAIVALPHRTGRWCTSVTDLGPYVAHFGCHFGAPWGSFPVVILNPILVIKTTTENRPFSNNLLQKQNLRRQNDDRKKAPNRDRKNGHWIPKSVSKRFRKPNPQKVKIWPRNPPSEAQFLDPSMARISIYDQR